MNVRWNWSSGDSLFELQKQDQKRRTRLHVIQAGRTEEGIRRIYRRFWPLLLTVLLVLGSYAALTLQYFQCTEVALVPKGALLFVHIVQAVIMACAYTSRCTTCSTFCCASCERSAHSLVGVLCRYLRGGGYWVVRHGSNFVCLEPCHCPHSEQQASNPRASCGFGMARRHLSARGHALCGASPLHSAGMTYFVRKIALRNGCISRAVLGHRWVSAVLQYV